MSGDNAGYIVLSFLGGLIVTLIAGGMYYANRSGNEYRTTGLSGETNVYYGGKKTHRQKTRCKKTRKL
jgi:hypothetical protein